MAGVTGGKAKTAPKQEEKLKEPNEFRVILLNDDYTTMDFVIEILQIIFHKAAAEANRIMLDVHQKGRGMVGVYTWDIALTKAGQVHDLARQNDFPLRCLVEQV